MLDHHKDDSNSLRIALAEKEMMYDLLSVLECWIEGAAYSGVPDIELCEECVVTTAVRSKRARRFVMVGTH